MYLNPQTMLMLLTCHVIALLISIYYTVREIKGQNRSEVLSAYVYVAFISILTILSYAPVVQSWHVPIQIMSAISSARDLAILFFVLGLGQLLKRIKGNNLAG